MMIGYWLTLHETLRFQAAYIRPDKNNRNLYQPFLY